MNRETIFTIEEVRLFKSAMEMLRDDTMAERRRIGQIPGTERKREQLIREYRKLCDLTNKLDKLLRDGHIVI